MLKEENEPSFLEIQSFLKSKAQASSNGSNSS